MKQNYKNKNQNNLIIRLMLFLLLVGGVSLSGWGQETIFHECVPTFTEIPSGWTSDQGNQTQTVFQSATGGYLLVNADDAWVLTKAYDLSSYTNVELVVDIASYGSGDHNPLTIEVSNDNGETWTELFTTNLTTGTDYQTEGPFSISADGDEVKFKFWRNAPSGRGVRFRNIKLTGTEIIEDPTLLAVPGTITGLNYFEQDGPSLSQTFELSGVNLDVGAADYPDITIEAPANFEISLNNADFFDTRELTASNGALDPNTIFVRLKEGLSLGSFSGDVSISGGGTTATVSLSGLVSAQYVWNNSNGGNWATAANWTPNRDEPSVTDRLLFNDGGEYTITDVPEETIAQLRVTNNTTVTFQAAAVDNTLTIDGAEGIDLFIGSDSALNFSGSNALQIALQSEAIAFVSGSIEFQNAAHKLMASDAGGITFNSGSVFTAGSGFSSNAFGSSNSGSVIFASGSVYVFQSGANPFATSPPVAIFKSGSTFRQQTGSNPSISGRIYADFEFDFEGSSSGSGLNAVSFDNFRVLQGTFNLNVAGTPGHAIKGNIEVSPGATLNFNPTEAGTVTINGDVAQSIFVNGTINANSNSTISIGNAEGVILEGEATLNNLTILDDATLTIGTEAKLTVTSTLINQNNGSKSGAGLLIQSDATSTGSLIHNNTGVNATVERYIARHGEKGQQGWHLLSAPVSGQDIVPEFFPDAESGPEYDAVDFYRWDESFSDDDVTGWWLNIKGENFGHTKFETATGYLMAFGTPNPGKEYGDKAHEFIGPVNVEDESITGLSFTAGAGENAGWHLLGNPFASAVEWGGWTTNNIQGGPSVWSREDGSYKPLIENDVIPAMNGFMIRVQNNETGSLTIPANNRKHDTQDWYKRDDQNDRVVLVARDTDTGMGQYSLVMFRQDAEPGIDPTDTYFSEGFAPRFYSIVDEEKLALNSLPELYQGLTIPFGFEKNNSENFRIELAQEFIGETLYLFDKSADVQHELTVGNPYEFTATTKDDPERFELRFGRSEPQAIFWRNEASSGYWSVGDNVCAEIGGVASQWWYPHFEPNQARNAPNCSGTYNLEFGNNHMTQMTNNISFVDVNRVSFEPGATDSRTIVGDGIDFRAPNDLVAPKINNFSTATHTFSVSLALHHNPMELNPINGDLVLTGPIFTNNNFIDVYGPNENTLTIEGVIEGGGGFTIKENTIVRFMVDQDYTGNTFLENGTLVLYGSLEDSDVTVQDKATLIVRNNNTKENGVVTLKSLTLESGGTVIIESDAQLTIDGTLTNDGGTIRLESDDAGTGSLIHDTPNIQATIERYIPQPSGAGGSWDDNYGWHLLSAPVSGQDIADFAIEPATEYDFYLWHEPSDTWINYLGGNWNTHNEADGNFTVGRGYMVAWASQQDFEFAGPVNVEDITRENLSFDGTGAGEEEYSKGWHLLGNPFASAITWNVPATDWGLVNVGGVAKIWEEASKSYIDVTTDGTHQHIPASQGFFVQVENTSNNITIPASARTHKPDTWYKDSETKGVFLVAREADKNLGQQSNIFVSANASESFDFSRDARFLPGYAPQFYSVISGERLSTKVLPEIKDGTMIPFGFVKNDAEDFAIEIVLENLTGDMDVILRDKKMDKTVLVNTEPVYTFSAKEGDDPMRFELHFGKMDDPTGIDEAEEDAVHAWYNNNTLFVTNPEERAELKVFDISGRQMYRFVAEQGEHQYRVNLPAGVYIVHTSTQNSTQSIRIVVSQ